MEGRERLTENQRMSEEGSASSGPDEQHPSVPQHETFGQMVHNASNREPSALPDTAEKYHIKETHHREEKIILGVDTDDDDQETNTEQQQEPIAAESNLVHTKTSLMDEVENALLKSKDESKRSTGDIFALAAAEQIIFSEQEDLQEQQYTESGKDHQIVYPISSEETDSLDALSIPNIDTKTTIESMEPLMPAASTEETRIRSSARTISPQLHNQHSEQNGSFSDHRLKPSVSCGTLVSLPEIGTKTTTESENEHQQLSWTMDDPIIVSESSNDDSNNNVRIDTPPLLENKSNETLMSVPDIGTSTTSDTIVTLDPDSDKLEEDQTGSKVPIPGIDTGDENTQKASKLEDLVDNEKTDIIMSDDDDAQTSTSSAGETEEPELGTDTTDYTDSDSTASRTLIQKFSDEVILCNNHLTGSFVPLQPEAIAAPERLDSSGSKDDEEKTEVQEDYEVEETSRKTDKKVGSKVEACSEPMIPDRCRKKTRAIKNTRPEYVSAAALKVEAGFEHGLEFISIDDELRISNISSTGLFWNSPLRPFDKMLRINNLNCETLEPMNATHLLNVLAGYVTVIAQNVGGDSSLIESQVTKAHPESEVGISFQDICRDDVLLKNEVEITFMGEKSVFSGSLLHVGDRILTVNDCVDLDSNVIDVMLQTSPRNITIQAKTKLKTQMAIARRPTHQLPPGFNVVRATAEARRQRAELRRKQGCYYNLCERPGAGANFFQWAGNVYVITIVIVGVVISWSTVKEHTYDGSDTVGTILKFMGLFVGGILLGFLVNAPWWFRKVGARFSVAQLVCNAIVIASFFILTRFFDSQSLVQDYRLVIFFLIFFPLLIIVNLPTIFVRREDGSDGNTLSDRSTESDDLSSSGSMIADNV